MLFLLLLRVFCDLDDRACTGTEAHALATNCAHGREPGACRDTLEEIAVQNDADSEQGNDPLRDDRVTDEGAPRGHELLDGLTSVGVGGMNGGRNSGDRVDVDWWGNLDDDLDRLSTFDSGRNADGGSKGGQDACDGGTRDIDARRRDSFGPKGMSQVAGVRSRRRQGRAEVQDV